MGVVALVVFFAMMAFVRQIDSNVHLLIAVLRNGRFAAEPVNGLTSLKGEPIPAGFGFRKDGQL